MSEKKQEVAIDATVEDAESTKLSTCQQGIVAAVDALSAGVEAQLAPIVAQLDELDALITPKLSDYEGADWSGATEEDETTLRNLRAEMNGYAAFIDSTRKDCKRGYQGAFGGFEDRMKSMHDRFKCTAGDIGQTLDGFAGARRAKREHGLRATYHEYAALLEALVPYELIEDPTWYRKGVSDAAAEKKLYERIDSVAADLDTFDALDIPHKEEARLTFLKTLDLSKARAESERLVAEEEAAEAEKQRVREVMERVQENRSAAQEPVAADVAPVEPEPANAREEAAREAVAPVETYVVTIEATREQIGQLVDAMRRIGIHGTVSRKKEQQ